MNQTPERINIKDLVIDTPDQTRHGLGFFNVQEAIGDKRWADMLSSLRIDLGSEAYYDYLTLLANMAFLCPERQLPDIDADLQESLRKSAGQIPLFSLKSIHAEKFCRIFPDYFESHLRQDPDFQEAKARLEPDINKPGSLGMLDLEAAEAHKILDPENPVALDDDVLQRWVRHYNNTDFETGVLITRPPKQGTIVICHEGDWWHILRTSNIYKILY